ncbi:MAG TPA: hypothetical protein VF116_23030 [Ktedonobacterales bacterium]
MTLYSLTLFAHIVGVLGLFVGMGLQWAATLRLRRARSMGQVREWSGLVAGAGRLGLVSGVVLLAAGIYMMVVAWGLTPWLVVSFAAMLVMLALGMGVTTRRLRGIQRTAATTGAGTGTGAIPATVQQQLHDPVVWIAAQMAGSSALGVVFLMTTKPDLAGSLLAAATALVLGAVVGIVSTRPGRADRAATMPMEEVA